MRLNMEFADLRQELLEVKMALKDSHVRSEYVYTLLRIRILQKKTITLTPHINIVFHRNEKKILEENESLRMKIELRIVGVISAMTQAVTTRQANQSLSLSLSCTVK